MPKPIVCLSDALRQFAEAFRSCFSPRQWKYFVIVLMGLMECEERKTMTGMIRVVSERISLSGMSRFLNKWRWDPLAVARIWLKRFRERMEAPVQAEHDRLHKGQPKKPGRPKQTVVTGYLALDDSVHTKPKGRKMEGLGRHYSNSEKRVVSGHCLFTGVYVLLGQRCPLVPKLYRQKRDCEATDTPFRSKIDLAVEEIEQFEPVADTHTHVLIDSWYHCRRVRRAARKRGFSVSGALKSNRWMRQTQPDGEREWVQLSAYADQLKEQDWKVVTWPSAEGGQPVYAHLVHTWVRKLGPTTLLITCHDPVDPGKSIRYWGSTQSDLDAQALVNILAIRWEIETFFEYDKDLLGSDHYQLMSAQGVLRFWALTACMIAFLEEQRAASSQTCGDIRRTIQNEHHTNFLHWLFIQFASGQSVEQVRLQLALCDS